MLCRRKLVPMAGEEAGKPVNQMRDELANNYNFDGVDELTIEEEYVQGRRSPCDISNQSNRGAKLN